jgi:vanillate/3-O-methylgallate O-demethylase
MGYPVPAIYTHDDMKAFREWLPADGWEANYQIGGSFVSDNIEDYYVTPYDHGYDHIVKFDHEFIGREALERLADNPPRTKVTLVWNEEDVQRVVGSLLEEGAPYKYIDMPLVSYAQQFNDRVLAPGDDDVTIGCAIYSAYSYNERALASLALIDRKYAEPGTEVSFVWGEPDGGSRKPIVETPHRQTTIRATVAPVPFGKNVQQTKHAVVKN